MFTTKIIILCIETCFILLNEGLLFKRFLSYLVMYRKKTFFILLYCLIVFSDCTCQQHNNINENKIFVGAERTQLYFPLLENKRIGLVANHTSMIGQTHIKDSLVAAGINLVRIFSPEHGFRGVKDAGEKWDGYVDESTGIPIVSLYGKDRKPRENDIAGLDIIIFDIQDVGVRFYTYISTMHYVMSACAEWNIHFLVLDRPNPNGFYVDGPVLDKQYSSFVGMHPVPIVHGMTIAEYAHMINEEGWLEGQKKCQLQWVLCKNYAHHDYYELPRDPSPNLQTTRAVYLYPSLGLFEGTKISVGRGTPRPFEVFGHPDIQFGDFYFTPESIPGRSLHPKHEGQECRGIDLRDIPLDSLKNMKCIQLKWLIKAYQHFPKQEDYFNSFFEKLTGTGILRKQIKQNVSEKTIRESWRKDLSHFMKTRKKYLLYPDYE